MLGLQDKNKFDKAYDLLRFPLQEHSFAWQYIWADTYKDSEVGEINGNLCLFLTFEGKRYLWGPPLPGNKLQETINEAFAKGATAALYIPEELRNQYKKLEGYMLEDQNQDYIYLREAIASLSGNKLKKKRNLRNYFVRHNNFRVEKFVKEKHMKGCLDLLELWKSQKKSGDIHTIELEVKANLKAFDCADQIGLIGMIVYVDGKIEGFTFGEKVKNICSIQIEKTSLKIKGLPQFIYSEFVKQFDDCVYVNAGEDWNVEYLKKTKESYNPVMIKKSYRLVKT